jgi:carbon-monoxide dehydrogenase medium subunit
MKSPNFGYLRARSLRHACEVLAEHAGEAVAIAGGQSLLPGLNMRLSSPRLLVDIGELAELNVTQFGSSEIRLGALTRHAQILESHELRQKLPLLPRAVSDVAHAAIRNRGTLGGSLAYADPAAELPACVVALDATILIAGTDGEREVQASDFFTGLMQTALAPGELIVAVRVPVPAAESRFAFGEFARRHGDFAVAGIVAATRVEDRRIADARVVYFGCVDRARLAPHVSAALEGAEVPVVADGNLMRAIDDDLDPNEIPGWRADTLRDLAKVLTRRALSELEHGMNGHGH